MANEQSKKNCYPSKYSNNQWIRPDQYIIEIICEKKAKKDNIDLPLQFWKNKEWEKFFKSQLRKCRSLLKKYSHVAIVKALKDQRAYSIYSLFAPWLEDIIQSYQHEIDRVVVKQESPEMSIGNFYRKTKKTNLDILDE